MTGVRYFASLLLGSNPAATRRMGVASFLTPKSEVVWVSVSGTVEQALERMKPNGFAVVPILDDEGCYVGKLSTSDLMWFLLAAGEGWQRRARTTSLLAVPRRSDGLPVRIDASVSVLVARAIEQSFVPVVSERNVFLGIVRRRPVLESCARIAGVDRRRLQGVCSR